MQSNVIHAEKFGSSLSSALNDSQVDAVLACLVLLDRNVFIDAVLNLFGDHLGQEKLRQLACFCLIF